MNEALQLHPGARQTKAVVVARKGRGKQITKALELLRIASQCYTSLPLLARRSKKSGVDLVLADLDMPGLSGEAAIRKLKEFKHDATLVLLTAKAPAAVGGFLEPDVLFCSFDDIKEGNLNRMIEKSKLAAARAPWGEVPIARHVRVDLHDPKSGRLDARRIAAYLQISLSSLASVTGRSIAAIHKAPAADSLQRALAPVARTISLLSEILQSKEHVRTWLHSPHPDLGNQIPMKLILEGRGGAVADMLAAALAGQPS